MVLSGHAFFLDNLKFSANVGCGNILTKSNGEESYESETTMTYFIAINYELEFIKFLGK